jgi:D-tyrosyl-tRNA(Tyr) deacylase
VKQKEYEILLVSQFTLYGKVKKDKPDYKESMKTEPAEEFYNNFVEMIRQAYEPSKVKDGIFGAMMDVSLVNDGPVTILLESLPDQNGEEEA